MIDVLLDSNVLVAASFEHHVHYPPSNQLFKTDTHGLSISAHSVAEAFNQLTSGRGANGWKIAPKIALRAIDGRLRDVRMVGLDPGEMLAAIRAFAALGGTGPRLYDYLIGEAGRQNGCDTIVTWNVRHMRPLFPGLRVATPTELARA